ncbi:hypothetical protein D2V93_06870 [Flagellimonas taeanensis]|nr:hypothetical protein D2V93_06870 [Allomuricauda taeanensis]
MYGTNFRIDLKWTVTLFTERVVEFSEKSTFIFPRQVLIIGEWFIEFGNIYEIRFAHVNLFWRICTDQFRIYSIGQTIVVNLGQNKNIGSK